eukprot:5122084-Ditylum_brightwellii.AAC.1
MSTTDHHDVVTSASATDVFRSPVNYLFKMGALAVYSYFGVTFVISIFLWMWKFSSRAHRHCLTSPSYHRFPKPHQWNGT